MDLTDALIQALSPVIETAVRKVLQEQQNWHVAPLLITPADAAKRLSIGRTMVYRLMDSKELESLYIGSARRIYYPSLVAYIERSLKDGQ